jgi:hypothetical protein
MANTDFIPSCFKGYLPVTDACFQILIVCYCYCFEFLRILVISHYDTVITPFTTGKCQIEQPHAGHLLIYICIFAYSVICM